MSHEVDRDFRDFESWSDAFPLPEGDPRSGAHVVPKAAIRERFNRVEEIYDEIIALKEYFEGLGGTGATPDFFFANHAAVTSGTVPLGLSVIRVAGRTSSGQGGAWYRRVSSSAHPFKLVDASGAVFEPTPDPAPLSHFRDVSSGNTTVTVGTGGDFPDLQAAIDDLWRYSTTSNNVVELRIVSALTKGLLVMRDCDRFRITSNIGTVPLAAGFQGVSNSFMESYGANTLAPVYLSTKNVIVGFNARMPRLGCLINMASPRGTGRLGSGIHLQGGEIYIEGGCGVHNAGLCGLMAQNAKVFGIEATFRGSGAENIRIQQTSNVTFQSAEADDGVMEDGAGLSISGAAVFISRGSIANLAQIKVRNSRRVGVEAHTSLIRMTEAEVTGSRTHNVVAELTSHISAYKAILTGAGQYGAVCSDGSHLSLNQATLTGCGLASVRMTNGGGIVCLENATTNNSTKPGVPVVSDISGVADVNWIGDGGIVYSNIDGPLQRLAIRSAGLFSETGASNGKKFGSSAVLDSSRDSSSTAQHHRFWNTNGQVGGISTSGTSTIFAQTSDARLKGELVPGAQEIDPVAFLMALQVWGYTWLTDGTRDIGLLAQELHQVKPSAVVVGRGTPGDADFEPWQIDVSKLVPELILGVQWLIEANDRLERRLSALERG